MNNMKLTSVLSGMREEWKGGDDDDDNANEILHFIEIPKHHRVTYFIFL